MTVESHEVHDADDIIAPRTADLSYRRLFALPTFPRLAAATVLGRIGGNLWQIALILFVLQRYHSPALAGFAAFLSVVPGLVISPLAGALLDRHGRVRLILVDYTVGTVALSLLATLSLLHHLSAGLLLVIVALGSLTGPLTASGTRTLFPLVVPRELWDRANAVDSGSQAIASVFGPALAGFFVAWFGGEGAFFITAGFFVASGMVLLKMRDPATEPSSRESLLRSSWQAVVYVVRHPTLRGVVFTLWATNIPAGVLSVALPVLVLRNFRWGPGGVGALWAVAGVTTIIAGAVVGSINTEGRERQIIASGLALAAVGCALTLARSPVAVVLAMAMFGLASGPIDIGLFALRQRRTDPRLFGRVFAVSMALNFAGIPVGSALGGPIIEHSIELALFVAAGVALLGCAVPFLTIPRDG
jgi:MFS family permease